MSVEWQNKLYFGDNWEERPVDSGEWLVNGIRLRFHLRQGYGGRESYGGQGRGKGAPPTEEGS